MLGLAVAYLGDKIGFSTTSIGTLIIDQNAVLSLLFKANKICTYGAQGEQALLDLGIGKEKNIHNRESQI